MRLDKVPLVFIHLSWKPAVMQNCLTSQGNLFQGLTVHTQRFFLIASLNFSSFNLCPRSPVLHLTPLWRAWLYRSLMKMLNRTVPRWPQDWIWFINYDFLSPTTRPFFTHLIVHLPGPWHAYCGLTVHFPRGPTDLGMLAIKWKTLEKL